MGVGVTSLVKLDPISMPVLEKTALAKD